MKKSDYNYTVHKDSEHEIEDPKIDNKVIATVALTFDNPEFKEGYTEKVTTPFIVYEENGEMKRDSKGEPVYEDQEQEVEHAAVGKKTLTFVQDIFITADKSKQDQAVKEYCESYEKDYVAQSEQPTE